MDCLMGIDLGSTSLKAIVYDLNSNVLASGSRPTQQFHPDPQHPQWTVWQPEQIWGGTREAIREAVSQLAEPRSILAVAVTGMGMDGLPVDDDGGWLYPFISWHDPRTRPQFDWWQEHIGAAKVFSIGGNPLWPINTALRILWMAEHEPEILKRTSKWLLIEDFLNFQLCGRCVTDYSMASCTLLFDQRTLRWSDELLALSGIDRRLLCEVLPSGTPIGQVHRAAAAATGLPEGTPVVLGGHDHLCGALPVGVFQPGMVLNVTGTWETVTTVTDRPVLKDDLRCAGMTVQAHVARGQHAIWGGNVAAEMLEWFRKQFAPEAADSANTVPWATLMAEAQASPPGARGVMFLPHMSSAACPIVDPRSLGAFVGLSTCVTRGDLLRALIEGLDYQFVEMVGALRTVLEEPLERFVMVGGATRNHFWMQNKADTLGQAIEVPEVAEASPLGAAILAGIGVGLYDDLQDAWRHVYRPGTTYQPDTGRAAHYARWIRTYRDLYPATRPISHSLFEAFLT
jgi:xylulokinase